MALSLEILPIDPTNVVLQPGEQKTRIRIAVCTEDLVFLKGPIILSLRVASQWTKSHRDEMQKSHHEMLVFICPKKMPIILHTPD